MFKGSCLLKDCCAPYEYRPLPNISHRSHYRTATTLKLRPLPARTLANARVNDAVAKSVPNKTWCLCSGRPVASTYVKTMCESGPTRSRGGMVPVRPVANEWPNMQDTFGDVELIE